MNLIENIPNQTYYVFYSETIETFFVPTGKSDRQYVMSTDLNEYLNGRMERVGIKTLEEARQLAEGSFGEMTIMAIQDVGSQFLIRKVEK